MNTLLNLNPSMAIADLIRISGELAPIFARHAPWLKEKFPKTRNTVDILLADIPRIASFTATANIENAERAQAESKQAILQDQIREYVQTARRRARRVCDNIKTEDFPTSRALASCIGITSRLSVTRNSEVNQLLSKTLTAHTKYRDLLKAWGSTDDFLDQAQTLSALLPLQTDELRKEQAEAEAATAASNALLSSVVTNTNSILETIEEFAPTEAPKVLQEVASVLNKYRYLLVSSRPDTAEEIDDTEATN